MARRTVERITSHNGWRGVTRARRAPRTTESNRAATRASDLVGGQWRVGAPNLLLVADFTYVAMTHGFGYTAFVVDAYAGPINTLTDLQNKTSAWVASYNQHRFMHRLHRRPPAEADYYARLRAGMHIGHTEPDTHRSPRIRCA